MRGTDCGTRARTDMDSRRVARAMLLAFLVGLLAASAGAAGESRPETFQEEALLRPLPGGRTAFVAHFRQETSLMARHHETFPKAIAQIARATGVADAELSFTQGRWMYRRWGRPPAGAKPIGAELWAAFDAESDEAADAGWANLTAMFGGQFCASLSALRETQVVVEPALVFRPWDGTDRVDRDAVASHNRRRLGSLPAEAVCTENLTPWLKLLPCRDRAGIASLLRSRSAVFGAEYVSFTARIQVRGDVLALTQSATLVLDANRVAKEGSYRLTALLGVNQGEREEGSEGSTAVNGIGACAVATSTAVHVQTKGGTAVAVGGEEPETGPGGTLSWAVEKDGFDVAVHPGEGDERVVAPQLYAERVVTGSGYHRGGISIELRKPEGSSFSSGDGGVRARVFQTLPWYVRVFIHTLAVEIDGVSIPVPTSGAVERKGGPVEALRWVPGVDRRRPSTMELQLYVPASASVARISFKFEKAFLRISEFPPDANRGFDLPAAFVSLPPVGLERDETSKFGYSPLLDLVEGGVAPGDTHSLEGVYMGGALLTLPTPDFSMPFNVTTMVCTLMSLLAGALLTTLTRRPGWAGFRERKAEQRRRLRALEKEAKKAS